MNKDAQKLMESALAGPPDILTPQHIVSLDADALTEAACSPDPEIAASANRLIERRRAIAAENRKRRSTFAVAEAIVRERSEQDQRVALESFAESLINKHYRPSARACRTNDCTRCTGPACPVALTCQYRFEGDRENHQIDDQPLCRYASDKAAIVAEADRIDIRRRRLVTAGVTDPVKLEVIPKCGRPLDVLPALGAEHAQFLEAPRAALAAVERALAEQKDLLLYGMTGTGKTWALAALIAEVWGAKCLSVSTIRPNDSWGQTAAQLVEAKLLVIPDLGTELPGNGNWSPRDEVKRIVCERADQNRLTAIASNLPFDDGTEESIKELYGKRIADRLRQGIVQLVAGPSLRKIMTRRAA